MMPMTKTATGPDSSREVSVKHERLNGEWAPPQRQICSLNMMPCLIIGLFMVISFAVPPNLCRGDQGDDMPKILRSGFLARVFIDVDPRDAQATLELMTREVSRNMGLNTSPKVVLFPDRKSMTEALRRGELDLVSMPGIEYLHIRETIPLTPSFVGAHNNGMGTRYLLITRRDSGIRSISDLKGKTLIDPCANKHEAGHVWLGILLMKEGRESPASFFRQVKETGKVSQAIMGIFFRQADGAIVTRAGLDAAKLLNPQLDRQIQVIAESGNLNDGITCFPASMPDKTQRALSNAIMKLSTSTTGRQLFTIFQTSGVIPFKAAYLEGLEGLLREESSFRSRSARKR
jgi:ABC-type phosphate/phosphonate transport system substrate-binding protein